MLSQLHILFHLPIFKTMDEEDVHKFLQIVQFENETSAQYFYIFTPHFYPPHTSYLIS